MWISKGHNFSGWWAGVSFTVIGGLLALAESFWQRCLSCKACQARLFWAHAKTISTARLIWPVRPSKFSRLERSSVSLTGTCGSKSAAQSSFLSDRWTWSHCCGAVGFVCYFFESRGLDLESFSVICFFCLQDVYLNCMCQGIKLDKFLIIWLLFDTVLSVLPFVSGSMDADFLGKADYVEQTPLAACAWGVE